MSAPFFSILSCFYSRIGDLAFALTLLPALRYGRESRTITFRSVWSQCQEHLRHGTPRCLIFNPVLDDVIECAAVVGFVVLIHVSLHWMTSMHWDRMCALIGLSSLSVFYRREGAGAADEETEAASNRTYVPWTFAKWNEIPARFDLVKGKSFLRRGRCQVSTVMLTFSLALRLTEYCNLVFQAHFLSFQYSSRAGRVLASLQSRLGPDSMIGVIDNNAVAYLGIIAGPSSINNTNNDYFVLAAPKCTCIYISPIHIRLACVSWIRSRCARFGEIVY